MSTIYYDVIIIGSGAGGGTLARHLAPSGKRILLLERGGWLPREPENWMAEEVFRSEEHTSELQSQSNLVCRLLLEKKKKNKIRTITIRQQHRTITSSTQCSVTQP